MVRAHNIIVRQAHIQDSQDTTVGHAKECTELPSDDSEGEQWTGDVDKCRHCGGARKTLNGMRRRERVAKPTTLESQGMPIKEMTKKT